jgi:hypothetical protein
MTKATNRLSQKPSNYTVALIHALILVVGLCALSVLLLRHFIGAPNFGSPLPISQGFERGFLGADERADRIAYLLWLISPLLVLMVTVGLTRLQDHLVFAQILQHLLKPLVVGAALIVGTYSAVAAEIIVLADRQKIAAVVAAVLAILVAAIFNSKRFSTMLAKFIESIRCRYRLMFFALITVCGWIILGLLLRLVVQVGSEFDTYHAPFAWADLQGPATGAFPLVSYIAQYSHIAGYFVEPYIRIFGGSTLSMSVLMLLLGGGITVFIFTSLRHFGSKYFALVGTTCVVAFGLLPNTAPGGYFQVFPLRYFGPFLLVALFALLLNRRDVAAAFGGGVVGALVALNNPEWGGLIAIAYLMFRLILVSAPKFQIRNLLVEGRSYMAGAIAFTSILGIYIRIRSGLFPNFALIFDFGKWLSATDLMVPDNSLGLGLVMYATFLTCVVGAFGGRFRSPNGSPNVLITSFVGVCGLLLMIYTSGRSLPVVDYAMFFWWGFAAVLLTGELLSWRKLKPAQTISLSGAVLVSPLVLLAIVIGSAVTVAPSPVNQINRILNGPRPTSSYIDKAITGIEELTTKDDVVLFALHDGRSLAAMAGKQDYFPLNSSVATGLHRGQVTAIVEAVLNSKATVAIIWGPCCTPGPTLNALRIMGFQEVNFRDTGWSGGRAGPAFLRLKNGPSGIRSSIDNTIRVSAIRSVLQPIIPSRAATAYWLESISSIRHKVVYPTLTVINSVFRMPNGDVILAGAQYLDPVRPNLSGADWIGFFERRTPSGKILWNSKLVDQFNSSIFEISTNQSEELFLTGLTNIDTTVGAEAPLNISASASDGKILTP